MFTQNYNLFKPYFSVNPSNSSSTQNLLGTTTTSNANKIKVLQNLNSFTDKLQEEREKRIKAGQAPNPVTKTERSVKALAATLTKNESGKTIHGRELQTPSTNILLKSKQIL